MQGISKRVAFLDYLAEVETSVSARKVSEGVESRFGTDYATDTAERNGILNALAAENLVKWRKAREDEREAKQQRFVFRATALGRRVAEENRHSAKVLLGGEAA